MLNITFIFVMKNAPKNIVYGVLLLLETLFIIGFCCFMYVGLRGETDHSRFYSFLAASIIIFVSLAFNCMLYCMWDDLTISISIIYAASQFFTSTKRILFI